jgi:hypothetical protein
LKVKNVEMDVGATDVKCDADLASLAPLQLVGKLECHQSFEELIDDEELSEDSTERRTSSFSFSGSGVLYSSPCRRLRYC